MAGRRPRAEGRAADPSAWGSPLSGTPQAVAEISSVTPTMYFSPRTANPARNSSDTPQPASARASHPGISRRAPAHRVYD
jgi:hypothetical protein